MKRNYAFEYEYIKRGREGKEFCNWMKGEAKKLKESQAKTNKKIIRKVWWLSVSEELVEKDLRLIVTQYKLCDFKK